MGMKPEERDEPFFQVFSCGNVGQKTRFAAYTLNRMNAGVELLMEFVVY